MHKDNKNLKKIISINSTRATAKGTKTIKKLKISKYLNLDDQKFYSTDENGFFDKKHNKFTITNKFLNNNDIIKFIASKALIITLIKIKK